MVISTIIVILFAVWKFDQFSPTEFVLMDHLTEYDSTSASYNRIYLVKNPSNKSSELKLLVEEFEKKMIKSNENYNHLYIKKHNYTFFHALTLSENTDYSQKSTTRSNLDNIGFLVSTHSLLDVKGKRIYNLYMRIGDIWYYKE